MKQSKYLIDSPSGVVDLTKLPIFEPLEQEDLLHFMRMSKLRIYKPGETIIEEGRTDCWIYFLIYGKVRIIKQNREISVLTKGGDLFGEMRFIDSSPRSASAYADGDTVCLALDTEYIEQLSGEDKTSFGYILYRILSGILAEKLRDATQEIMQLKGNSNRDFWE
jgi:CRP/FNR family transcriptional regulator, cyclic AMP receptor protein